MRHKIQEMVVARDHDWSQSGLVQDLLSTFGLGKEDLEKILVATEIARSNPGVMDRSAQDVRALEAEAAEKDAEDERAKKPCLTEGLQSFSTKRAPGASDAAHFGHLSRLASRNFRVIGRPLELGGGGAFKQPAAELRALRDQEFMRMTTTTVAPAPYLDVVMHPDQLAMLNNDGDVTERDLIADLEAKNAVRLTAVRRKNYNTSLTASGSSAEVTSAANMHRLTLLQNLAMAKQQVTRMQHQVLQASRTLQAQKERAKEARKAEKEKNAAEDRDKVAAGGPAAFKKYEDEERNLAKHTREELRALSLKYYGVDVGKGVRLVGKVREKLEALIAESPTKLPGPPPAPRPQRENVKRPSRYQ